MAEEESMTLDEENLRQLYDAFNAQNIEAILPELAPDVRWANGMEGGFVVVQWRNSYAQQQ